MKLLFGGKRYFYFQSWYWYPSRNANIVLGRITKLLGESFKLHSHTLTLSDDIGMTSSSSPSPSATPEADDSDSEIE